MNAQEIIKQIEKQSENHSDDERWVDKIEIDEVARQGDIYLIRVHDDVAFGEEIHDRQLAKGSSKGSRHVATGNLRLFGSTRSDPKWGDSVIGPIIKARGRFTVTHPEHADVSLPKGTYQVCYQVDARTREAVRD